MTLRPSVRLRLTLLYGGLFIVAGALLLVVNYGLVRSRLPPGPVAVELRGPDDPPVHLPLSEEPVVGTLVQPPDPSSPEGQRIQRAFEAGADALRRKTLDELLVQSASALGMMSVVAFGLGWAVAGRVLRPLHQVTATARRLSEENLHERIAMEGPKDELKELADTFDAMLERLDAAFEGQKRFIANASHELRTPLAIQRALIDVALADPDRSAEELAAVGDQLRAAIDRSERLIDGLLLLARSERRVERAEPVDLADAAADAVSAARAEADRRGVRLEAQLAPASTGGEPPLLERAVANLVENAVRHNVEGGWASVATSTAGDRVRVLVVNSGPVVDEADVGHLFEPFRRLDERTGSAASAGLGLSIVRSVAEAHGGEVRTRARVGGGLEVELVLPSRRSQSSAAPHGT